MKEIQIKVVNEGNNPILYATKGSAGFDISANETISIRSGTTRVVKTGLFMEIPEGYELQIRPRSGMSLKTSLRVANSPGTIDNDYRGEIGIIIHNTGEFSKRINKGDRIAQGVINEITYAKWKVVNSVDDLSKTERSDKGFGSTGK